MKKKVVIRQSLVPDGKPEYLFQTIDDRMTGKEKMKMFLAKSRKFFQSDLTIISAINILGKSKVITGEQAAEVWGIEVPKNIFIRYSEDTLRQCAKENEQDKADWRLIFYLGFSLRDLYQNRNVCRHEYNIYNGNTWWLRNKEDKWANKKYYPNYYLLNFRGQFANMKWEQQGDEIRKMVKEFKRCPEAVFAEAILTNYLINGKDNRIPYGWWHWGNSITSFGSRVTVSFFNTTSSLCIYYCWEDHSAPYLQVCVFRGFDN